MQCARNRSAARNTISLKTEAEALTTSWQPFAVFTIPRRFRAFTSVTAMVLLLPRKRRARPGSRSPHQTVCPCRSSNCARREPVAPAPKTKIRMAWPKLYHNPIGLFGWRLVLAPIAPLGPEAYTMAVTPTPEAYRRDNPRLQGRGPQTMMGPRVWAETPGPPVLGKER